MHKLQQGISAAGICFFFFAVFGACPFVWAQNQAITFSATGDVPYGPHEMPKFQQQISNHNRYSPSAFFVHLGDVFTSGACGDSSYALMANTLKSLAVPVYIIPGDNETIDCFSPGQGLELWKKYFLNYEKNFCGPPSGITQHQSTRPENWTFMMNGVLFIGIHNVGGSSPYQQDADWTVQQLQTKGSQVRAAVVFSHADPERSTVFSTPFRAAAAAFGKPVLFLHGHGHAWSMGYPFPEKNILRVQVDNGAAEEPIEVTVTAAVTTNPDSMFIIKRRPWSNFVVYNMPPCVHAGPDQTLTSSTVANLQGAATDDGDPNGKLTTMWSKVSGPGTVTFGNATSLATTASFNVSGAYVLRLTADDSQLQKDDEVNVVVNGGAYSLSVSAVGSGTVTFNPPGGVYNNGAVVTLTAQSATGFRFTGWSGDLTGSSNPATITMNGNKNVIATFTSVQRILTVNTVGSGSVSLNPAGGVYNDGVVVTLTAQSATGFRFTGWSGDLTGSSNPATITMNGNKNVIATFTSTQRILTVNSAGSGTVSFNPTGGVYNDGAAVTLTAQSGTGFRFTGWSGDLTGLSNPATITMNANKTVTATFTLLPVAIVHEETLTGSVSNSATLTTSAALTGVSGHLYLAAISMRPKVGVLAVSGLGLNWTLVKAKCSGRNTTGVEVWMAQGIPRNAGQRGAVIATFASTPSTAVMAVSRYSGAAASNPIGNALTGNTKGMNASGACAGGADSNLYSFDLATTMNGAVVYSAAALKARAHTPNAGYVERTEAHQAGGVNTSGVAVIDKTVASVSTVTVNGTFGGVVDWAVAALEIKPQIVTQLTLNTIGSGSVTLNPPGSQTFSGGVYNQGTVVILTAQSGTGFRFTGWSGDLAPQGGANPVTIAMNLNKNVTATFAPVQRTLTVNTVGSGNVSLNPPGGVYNDGTVVTLTEVPAAGFQFNGWSGALTGATNPATITMNANLGVTATFTANPNTNLAKNRPMTASSSYAGKPPENAVDGSASTYWRSLNKLDWLRVDLGAAMTIARVVVNWNQSYYAKSYEVQVSNDAVSWNTASSAIGKIGIQTLNFSPTPARYVRLYFKENNKSNYRITEFEIYSGAASASKRGNETVAAAVPNELVLEQNYPNPFSANGSTGAPSTQIRFALPQESHIAIKVYTINGAEVRTLANGRYTAGTHAVIFEAGNLPSGTYFYVMQAGAVRQVRRLMLVK